MYTDMELTAIKYRREAIEWDFRITGFCVGGYSVEKHAALSVEG